MHWFHKGHKGVRWPFEQPSVRSMRAEMKTVTFTLVCAPGQEGPLQKVTLSAFSLFLHLRAHTRLLLTREKFFIRQWWNCSAPRTRCDRGRQDVNLHLLPLQNLFPLFHLVILRAEEACCCVHELLHSLQFVNTWTEELWIGSSDTMHIPVWYIAKYWDAVNRVMHCSTSSTSLSYVDRKKEIGNIWSYLIYLNNMTSNSNYKIKINVSFKGLYIHPLSM